MKSLCLAVVTVAGLLCATAAEATTPAPATPTATPSASASASAPRLRIMALGDSITAGVGSATGDGYRYALQQRLGAAGVPVDFVGSQQNGLNGDPDNEGHGGWTVDQLSAGLDLFGWVRTYRPNVVLLHAGTNNVTEGEDPALIADKLSTLIDDIRADAPLARIYVAKIIDTTVASEVATNRAYNALIPGVVASKDARVHLVDQSAVGDVSIYDVHHPNEFGYAKLAWTWYQAMRATLAPYWPAGGDNPYLRTAHVYLRHYDFATRTTDRAYWSLTISAVDGRRVRVWVRDPAGV